MKILLTGGAGYIGSHTFVTLREAGHEPVILDNFSNSSRAVISRLKEIFQQEPVLEQADIRDRSALRRVFQKHSPEVVIHFAGAKAVGESATDPLKYYSNNVSGTQTLLEVMEECNVRNLVFSSSATVYGDPQQLPLTENHPLGATNTYGATKLVVEDMLRALFRSDPRWSIAILRYFNPVGAHASGNIGEDPSGLPNNLMPFISQVAVGRLDKLQVFGKDYDTHDGTGIRDYLHVCDLAEGHNAALVLMGEPGCTAINLGTGKGYSVLDMVHEFQKISGRTINCEFVARRPGDIAACWAEAGLAKDLLGWEAKRDLEAMCADSWRWQSNNPNGYDD